ncbi:MAG: restriction endonuclease subunit S [Elusimicrobiaceae bacterium]|nr:restriction endonuclease subunit S [Elusimicrobiaceae bacterium]
MQKSDWKKYKLKDLGQINKSSISKNDKFQTIVYLDTGNMLAGQISETVEYPILKAPSRARRKVQNNSIVYSMVRPNQLHYGLIRNPQRNFIVSTGFAVFDCYEDKAYNRFIYYWLTQSYITELLQSIAENSTSAYPAIRPEDLGNLEINLPPVEEQKRIAQILGSLDDKIELLQKQNKTLEDMAKAIFKSWFVDFDVVHAKQKGLPKADIMREYHLTDELYDLFPSDFENSSLGPIPTGWQVKILGDFFPVKTGKKDANVASKIGKYPFFSCAQNILRTDEYSFDNTALLLAGNGDFNLKWYRGKFEAYQRTYVLIPNHEKDLPFLYYAMQFFLDKITLGSRGSVIKFITKGMIENYKLVIPEEHLWKYMSELLGQWTNKIESNLKQIQTLTELRDTLLPPLISGKIRV